MRTNGRGLVLHGRRRHVHQRQHRRRQRRRRHRRALDLGAQHHHRQHDRVAAEPDRRRHPAGRQRRLCRRWETRSPTTRSAATRSTSSSPARREPSSPTTASRRSDSNTGVLFSLAIPGWSSGQPTNTYFGSNALQASGTCSATAGCILRLTAGVTVAIDATGAERLRRLRPERDPVADLGQRPRSLARHRLRAGGSAAADARGDPRAAAAAAATDGACPGQRPVSASVADARRDAADAASPARPNAEPDPALVDVDDEPGDRLSGSVVEHLLRRRLVHG